MPTLTPTTETDLLLDWLTAQQRRIVGILAGLDEEALRRTILPSGWSCSGLLQHLTLGVRFWCACVIRGEPVDDWPDDDFAVADNASGAELLAAYEEAIRTGPTLVRDLPLTTPPAWWPEGLWGDWRLGTLQEVLLHLLVETTAHAGHLDVVRELIDGRTWDYARDQLSDPVGV